MSQIIKSLLWISLPLMCLVFFACNKNDIDFDQDDEDGIIDPDKDKEVGILIFNSGFEPDSRIIPGTDPFVSDDAIIGKDISVGPPNDWIEDFSPAKKLQPFRFQYQLGDTTMRKLRIVPDPVNPNNKVLSFWVSDLWVNASGNTVGRIQGNIRTHEHGSIAPTDGLQEFFQKNRMFVHQDVSILGSYPGTGSFFTFLEIWNNHDSQPYGFRIKLGMGKTSSDPGHLYFVVSGEDYDNKWVKVWEEYNTIIRIPIGEWVTMEYYVKQGSGNKGRFYVAMTRNNGQKQVIFDVQNFTHNTKDPSPDGFTFWNPLKLYITNKERMDFIKNNGKSLRLYFDDLEVWKDRRP
jgi:hypothetical protein